MPDKKKKKRGAAATVTAGFSAEKALKASKRLKEFRVGGALLLYVVVCGMILSTRLGGIVYHEGDIVESDIVSRRTIQFEDSTATKEERNRAGGLVESVFRIDERFLDDVTDVFRIALEAGMEGNENAAADSEDELMKFGLKRRTIEQLLGLEKVEISRLRMKALAVAGHVDIEKARINKDMDRLEKEISAIAAKEGVRKNRIGIISEVVAVAAKRNVFEDKEALKKRVEEARAGANPVMRNIKTGEVIARRGDPISRRHLDAMQALGLGAQKASGISMIGQCLLIFFAFIIIGVYLKTLASDVYRSEKMMIIFYILVFLCSLTTVMIATADFLPDYLFGAPIAALTILIAVLLRPVVALFAVPVFSLALAITLGLSADHFFAATIASMAAYYFSVRHRDKDSLIKAGAAVSLSNMAIIAALALTRNHPLDEALRNIFICGGLNGVIAAVAAMGSLPAFEMVFNVTTPHRLLELSNPEEPLLKKMLINAPGTYYHSFFVGNLAEAMAEMLNANALLVRVACYYHDVGKIRRPYFFTENQIHGVTHLPEMTPTLNSLVISAHLKDGIEMAREHKLPDEIIDIIAQHHGTMLISYFYKQAQADAAAGEEVAEERFRYPGPKPQTIEAAIVMLSDSCEAAVRSIKSPTPKLIENMVNNIVRDRVVDGQFQECNITLKQIDSLRLNLTKTLANIYHSRMVYPDLEDVKSHKGHGNGKH